MNKLLLTMLLIVISAFAFSQQNKNNQTLWHLTIADSATTKGIEKATIEVNRKRIFITGVKGVITINKSFVSAKDSVRISSVGYHSIVFEPANSNRFPDTVRLSESVTLLKEVKINPTKSVGITLSSPNKYHDTHMYSSPDNECAQYIPNDKNIIGTITSVEYELNDDLHGIEMPFNVEILSRSKDSIFPDSALTKDSIIVYNPEKKHHLTVDISRYHIKVPENGFFVVFQTLSPSYYSKERAGLDGHDLFRLPALNIYLKERNNFDGECCDPKPPMLTGYYCLMSGKRKDWKSLLKTDQWIVYSQGTNFAISATISPN